MWHNQKWISMEIEDQEIHTKHPLTIQRLIEIHATEQPDAIAIAAPGRSPLTYGKLYAQVKWTVEKLNAMGVGRNDRVAIVLPNGPEMAVTFLAVASTAASAPLNPAYRTNDYDFYLTDLDAKALITMSGFDTPAIGVAQQHGIPIIQLTPMVDAEAGLFSLEGATTSPVEENGFAEPEEIALVLHTSGTTSRPKMVPLKQIHICTSAENIQKTLALTTADRCLNVMPLFHIHGLIGATLSSIYAGASIICTPGFHAEYFFEWMDTFKPTWYSAVPTIHQAILSRASTNIEIIRSNPLRFIRSSSASLPPRVMEELEEVFHAPVIESYGMTEASHQMTSNPLPPLRRKSGTVGLPAGPEVAIMHEKGHLLKQGETGEIVIRGPNVMEGYENNPEANEVAFTDGWFRTGDEGHFDSDGYLYISGRIKEIINRGGEKITPREVDEALLEHPSVAQALTFALPHPTLGEDVAAAIVLMKNESISEKDLRDFAFTRLAPFKVPSQLIFVKDIPKGPTGKLQRIGLAERLESHLRPPFVAPQNETHRILAELMADVLKIDKVGIHDNFFTLGGDSLLAALLFSQIEDKFGKKLPLATLFQSPTIEQLADILEDETWTAPWSSMVAIQPEGNRPPLYFVHAHEGNVLEYYLLSKHLGLDQPFYGLQAQGLNEREIRLRRIEDMASHYIEEIYTVQPDGPYYLGGWCMGGIIAYEMAQQLRAQGKNVAFLAMLNTNHPDYPEYKTNTTLIRQRFYQILQRIDREYCNFSEISGFKAKSIHLLRRFGTALSLIKVSLEKVLDWGFGKAGIHLSHSRAFKLKIIEEQHTLAYAQYIPQSYEGDTVIIAAQKQSLGVKPDPTLGWERLIQGELRLEQVPGYRIGMLTEPRVGIVAEKLSVCIDEATIKNS